MTARSMEKQTVVTKTDTQQSLNNYNSTTGSNKYILLCINGSRIAWKRGYVNGGVDSNI